MTDAQVRSAEDLALIFRRRAIELCLSHREVDARADLPDGYFSKLVAGMKVPGGDTIVRVCAALELRILVDADAHR